MSPAPKKPAEPKEGKVADTMAEEAAEAKAATAAEGAEATEKPQKPSRAKKKAEEPKAEAAAEKPKRTRAKKADEPKAADANADEVGRGGERSETGGVEKVAASTSRRRRHRQKTEPAVLVRAQARYVRTSARKARLVCDHIRGKDVVEARAILAFTPRAAAKPWLKLLESAVANAEHNHELVGEELKIAAVHADEGPTLKRFRPRAMGRATRIRKRTSHLSITLTPKES
jgi:ribosomal protein L22